MVFQENEEEKGEFSQRRMSNGSNNQSGGVTQALAQAESYIEEFFQSEIELMPNVTGQLKYWRGEKQLKQTKPQSEMFFILRVCAGELLFSSKLETLVAAIKT